MEYYYKSQLFSKASQTKHIRALLKNIEVGNEVTRPLEGPGIDGNMTTGAGQPGNEVQSMARDEVRTSPLLIDSEVGNEVTRPLEGHGVVGNSTNDAGLPEKVAKNDDLRGKETTCTGLQEGRTGPLLRDEGHSTGQLVKTAV